MSKPNPKPDFRQRFENLKNKGKISEKKVKELIEDLLHQVYTLESTTTFLTEKVEEVKNNPLVNALLKWEQRLDDIDQRLKTLDNSLEACQESVRDPHRFDEDLH